MANSRVLVSAAVFIAGLAGTVTTPALAQDGGLYFGIGLGADVQKNAFGGFNTVGGFSNRDEQDSRGAVLSLSLGKDGFFSLGATPVTAEVEGQIGQTHDVLSASFPGLPNPEFQYDSEIRTARLGLNLWAPVAASGDWSFAAGFGLGVQQTRLKTFDGVVRADDSDSAGFGMIGFRAMRDVGANGRLALDLRYYKAGETTHQLVDFGFDAGELTHSASGLQVLMGYQIEFPR